jgi:L-fuconolactonase
MLKCATQLKFNYNPTAKYIKINFLKQRLQGHKMIDTHIHIWNFDKAEYAWLNGNESILNKTYTIEELQAERLAAGIAKGVLVQAANNFEDTDWMLENAASTDWIKGVVGWLPLQNPAVVYKALQEKYLGNTHFKGVRHLIHDEPDVKWLLQPAVIESLRILAENNIPYDVVGVLPQHIETALEVAKKVPSLKMVFDHLNHPPIKTKEQFGIWGELMKQAVQHKNFHAKISGLGTASGNFQGWSDGDLQPYIQFVIEQFGVDRCFCGGDWPVGLLAGSYFKTISAYRNIIGGLVNEEAQEKIFVQNATTFYNL